MSSSRAKGLMKDKRLRVFEYRTLEKAFGHKRDEVTGEMKQLLNE